MSEITISYLNATNDNNRSATTTARTTKTHSQPVEETVSVTVSSLYFLSAGSGTLRVVVLHRSTMYMYVFQYQDRQCILLNQTKSVSIDLFRQQKT